MSPALVLLFFHITTMITAVTISYGPGTVLFLAVRAQRFDQARLLIVAMAPFERLIPAFYVVGGLFGLATALSSGFNLLAPWLVIAYVLWIIAMATGGAVHARYHQGLQRQFAGVVEGPISDELALAIADPRERSAAIVDYVVIVLLLFDMVVKPFS
jgi:hypothetical protein